MSTPRVAAHEIESLLLHRWSPRAMSGEELTETELRRLFEAARWAPSCFNEQPWRFVYARRGTAHWERCFGLLVESNQTWCARGAVLLVVIGKRDFTRNGKPNRTAQYDVGAAWENLALQGSAMGLVVHGMAGFDYDRARTELAVPDDHDVLAMAVVGRPGDPAELPEKLRAREQPSDRRPLDEFVYEGRFGAAGTRSDANSSP